MPAYKSFSALMCAVGKKVDRALKKEVAQEAAEELSLQTQAAVYDAYQPVLYERRGKRGGLLDKKNIAAHAAGGVLTVKNTARPNRSLSVPPVPYAPPNDTQFGAWLERGEAANIFGVPPERAPWLLPRPFVATAAAELRRTGKHLDALKRGLKRQGIPFK